MRIRQYWMFDLLNPFFYHITRKLNIEKWTEIQYLSTWAKYLVLISQWFRDKCPSVGCSHGIFKLVAVSWFESSDSVDVYSILCDILYCNSRFVVVFQRKTNGFDFIFVFDIRPERKLNIHALKPYLFVLKEWNGWIECCVRITTIRI